MHYDDGKLRYDLIPAFSLMQAAAILTYGSFKYSANSWQRTRNGFNRYLASLMRHVEKIRLGEMIDAESGLHHAAHIAVDAMFLTWFHRQKQTKTFNFAGVREKWEKIRNATLAKETPCRAR